MDGWDGWLSYTAVIPRASLKSDANKVTIKTVKLLFLTTFSVQLHFTSPVSVDANHKSFTAINLVKVKRKNQQQI